MLAAICRRESSALAKASAKPCNAAGFCLGSPIGRRCKAPLLGLSAGMPGTRRAAPDSRRPARAGIPTELPATSRCRPEFCGDVARAGRSGVSRATAPRRLSGHAAGGVPRGGGGERSPWPPRRVQPPLRWGHGRRLDNANVQGGPFPAGWPDGALGMLET